MTKTYTTKSNALRAAKSAGFAKEEVAIIELNGGYYFQQIAVKTFEEMVQEIHDAGTQVRQELAAEVEAKFEARRVTDVESSERETSEFEREYGMEYCPHCCIHLSNGVGQHRDEVNGKMVTFTKEKQFWCMACEGEFGPDLPVAKHVASKATPFKIETKSEAERPCKLVWAIADQMPDAKRKEVIAVCVAKGVAFNTARTQYQQWYQLNK